jgi:transposase
MAASLSSSPSRFMGLDVHKHYLVAIGVDAQAQRIYGPRRVELSQLRRWIDKDLTQEDAVVLEMTTNTWQLYDELVEQVHSVTVVHPPHVALITQPRVMTDKIAADTLARLHAKGLLVGIWVPPQEVRDLRSLIAQRRRMQRLSTQAKNRLHALLHRHHLQPPDQDPFSPRQRSWWNALALSGAEQAMLRSDWATLEFAQDQAAQLEASLTDLAAQDPRLVWLVQLPGIGLINGLTILGAIGKIGRFPSPKHLVGYAGLGAKVHDSGQTTRTGKITKTGRRDLRAALVEAAQSAANTHPHWKAELARLEPRLGRNKAIVAIARKLLVAVWHVLSQQTSDRFAQPELLARKFWHLAGQLGKSRRPAALTASGYARQQLDRLQLGQHLTEIQVGAHKAPVHLPPSTLAPPPTG